MCIGVFLWRGDPHYPFILFLNRDEYHNRPTKAVGWWEGGDIVGGRDELGGGTWLACSRSGRFAFLTNVRELHSQTNVKTRGELPVRFLEGTESPKEFADEVVRQGDWYNGFNLIIADFCSMNMVYITNRPKGDGMSVCQVSPGVHVLTNSSLDTPWPKALRLQQNFRGLLDQYSKTEYHAKEMAEKLMQDRTKDNDTNLPGIYPPEFEHQLSSIFVEAETPKGRYGTRSTSVVFVEASGGVRFYERYIENDLWKEHEVSFHIES
ncbi:hypothetical protein Leryth_001989 [Lithospermum erythrorhizon]|nr:hypothetical protein Leryth_001989 [Lithospermum erythrorhizon]